MCNFRKEVLTMENLVVSIFLTLKAKLISPCLVETRQTQTTKVAQIALVKNENGHIVGKRTYAIDFEDSTTDAAKKVACSVQLSGF